MSSKNSDEIRRTRLRTHGIEEEAGRKAKGSRNPPSKIPGVSEICKKEQVSKSQRNSKP